MPDPTAGKVGLRERLLAFLQARESLTVWLEFLPGALWLGVFLIIPLAMMVVISFWRTSFSGVEAAWNLDNYRKFLTDPMFIRLLLKSMRIAITVTVLLLIIAYPLAYWLAKKVHSFKYLALILMIIPYWISYVIRTYAWYPLLGNKGFINALLLGLGVIDTPLQVLIFNQFTTHLGLMVVYLPFAVIPIYLSLDRLSDRYLEAAQDLGAGPFQTFMHVTLPLSLPGVLGASLMVFILAVGAYVTPEILGGPSGIMYGQIIADQFGITFNWAWGGTLALFLMVVALTWILSIGRWVKLRKIFVED